jgi:UDP-2-acetamido-3-amino-2,3-dideoxy-glucuronate N-acetyltransferase
MIHETAVVDEGAMIGNECRIWHFSHICGTSVIGEKTSVGQNVYVANHVTIGSQCKIQNNVSIYEGVHIGNKVFLGPSCVFTNDRNPRATKMDWVLTPTYVDEGATIGGNATIVCGNRLGRYCMIGAGSTVTHDVPPYALMVGVPARQIGWVSEDGWKLPLPVQYLGTPMIVACPISGKPYAFIGEGQVLPASQLTVQLHEEPW